MPSQCLAARCIHPATQIDKKNRESVSRTAGGSRTVPFGADASLGSASTPRRGPLRAGTPRLGQLVPALSLPCVTAKVDWKVPARNVDLVAPEFRVASAVRAHLAKGCNMLEFSKTKRQGEVRRLCAAVEALEGRVVLATFHVNTFADTVAVNLKTGRDSTNHVSLRSAIMAADADRIHPTRSYFPPARTI